MNIYPFVKHESVLCPFCKEKMEYTFFNIQKKHCSHLLFCRKCQNAQYNSRLTKYNLRSKRYFEILGDLRERADGSTYFHLSKKERQINKDFNNKCQTMISESIFSK